MPTDAEIGKFLTERVLGWELEFDLGIPFPPGAVWPTRPTPDFLTWDGFGLLLTALADQDNIPDMNHGWEGDWLAVLESRQHEDARGCLGRDPDLRRALMLAAAKAYGMEGV